MKNVKFNFPNTENTEKNKMPIKKLDSFKSFIILKEVKSKKKLSSTNEVSNFKRLSVFANKNKGDFIGTRQKYIPKNSQQNENIIAKRKKIPPMKILEKYARYKFKKDYINPFIDRLIIANNNPYKTIKNEDKPTYYNLYKVNDICNNKKSRLNLNFIENSIFLSEKEYLIKLFHKDEYRIVMRYLLGYIFFNNEYTKALDNKYNHRKRFVYNEFMNYINNNYTLIQKENENNEQPTINKQDLNFFLFNENLIKLSLDAERDKRDYPLFKSSNYFLIKDMPNKMVPNAIPNYYFNGNIIHILLKKYSFYKKFNVEVELIKNFNKNNNCQIEKENDNISYIEPNKEFNVGDNLSNNSKDLEEKNQNKNITKKVIFGNDDINDINKRQNILSDIEKLLKNLKLKDEEKNERFDKKVISIRPKKHITIKKKKKIKQPYEFYEIIHNDDFYINRTEKSKVLKIISDEMFNLTSLDSRNIRKHTTRVHFKPNLNIDNLKTLNNDKFIRKNRVFKTNINLNNNFNDDYRNFNRSRNNRMKTYKINFFRNEFNSFNLKRTNNDEHKNIKMKIFNGLIKQKKISFSIIAKLNIIKFKETSNFISKINKSIKEKLNTKKLIKAIIINYHKENNERKINSLNFPKINKFTANTISNLKTKNIKFNKNKNEIMNYRNIGLTTKKTIFKNSLKMSDIFKHTNYF